MAKTKPAEPIVELRPNEIVAVADLAAHPKNYRSHPADQLAQIAHSLQEHGLYRPVVVARDLTILAGHGVVEAAKTIGLERIAVIRLDLDADDPEAIKLLTGDNELGRLAEVDDRLLSEHLKFLADQGMLMGTGFDDQMLASLLYATRPASEIASQGAAEHWVGMPDFGQADAPSKIVVQFDNPEDRDRFMTLIGVEVVAKKTLGTWSIWWPPRDKEDLSSYRFE